MDEFNVFHADMYAAVDERIGQGLPLMMLMYC